MGMNTDAVQRLYVAYFNRPADPVSMSVYESLLPSDRAATQAELQALAEQYFSPSAEYTAMYAGMSNTQIVNQLYLNIFGRAAEVDGLVYWAAELTAGRQTVASIALQLSYSAQGTDADVVANRIEAANAFTSGLNTAEEITGYSGTDSAASARAWLQTVGSDDASKDAAIAGVDTAISNAVAASQPKPVDQAFALTANIDEFTGGAGNDTFTGAKADGSAQYLTALDKLDGGDGVDTLNITLTGDIASVTPSGATVKNIENVNLQSNGSITANASGFTGNTSLTATAGNEVVLTAAATADVVASSSAFGAGAANSTIDGGKNVTYTVLAGEDDNVVIGGTTAPTGVVTFTGTYAQGTGNTHGDVTVTGGTTQSITMTNASAANTDSTMGAVVATGTAATTSVSVIQSAAATKSATKAGVVNGAVTVNDVNRASTTKAGTITDVTVHSGAAVTVNSGALQTLNLKGTFTSVNAGTLGALTTAAINSLQVNANGVTTTGAVTIDSDVKTLNIDNSTGASSFNSLSAAGATKLNITGDKKLTVTSHTLTAATVIDASAATGGTTFSAALAAGVTYKGGDGVDTITLSTGGTKAITTGGGNDVVTYGGPTSVAANAVGSVDAGAGDDTIIMTTAQANAADASAAFNSSYSNFEILRLSDQHTGTIDMAGLGNMSKIVLSSGGDNTTTAIINSIASGATVTQLASGTGVVLNVRDAAFNANDSINLALSSSSIIGAGSITTAGVETVNINVADAGATGSAAVIHTLTLVATSAKTVTVSGNNGLTLTNANTAITTFDASGVVGNTTSTGTDTAANLAVTFASANTTATASVTIKGGAGNDTLTGTVAKDTIEGNDGADTIYADNAGNKTSFATANIDVTGTPTGATTVTVSFMGLTTAATSVTLAGANPTATEIQTAVKAAVAADPVISKLLSVTSSGAADLVFASLIDGTNTTAPVVTITPTGGAATYTAGAATAGTAGAVAVDSVSGGAGADVLLGGGGGDTLTGGAGVDTFFFLKGQSNLATMTKISDYTYALGGTQNDKIVIGDVTSAAGTVTTVQDLSSAQSLAAALDMAATNNTVNNGISWFIYGGNTYVYVETTGATGTYQAADFVVEITGTPVAAGTAIAGLGGDGI